MFKIGKTNIQKIKKSIQSRPTDNSLIFEMLKHVKLNIFVTCPKKYLNFPQSIIIFC